MKKNFTFWTVGLGVCLISIPLSVCVGPLDLGFRDVLAALLGWPGDIGPMAAGPDGRVMSVETLNLVVRDLRLPRVLLALLTGAGLAVAGVLFQGILRNPLADPFTLGVSGGAAFGAALCISMGLGGAIAGLGLPLAAFAGAGAALVAVLTLGTLGGRRGRESLILAGVVTSAFLAALIALVKALDESSVGGIVFWIMGSFQGRGWREAFLVLPCLCLGLIPALAMARELDLLALGDRTAVCLGLPAGQARLFLLLAASAVTAGCVAVSGIIGFIGLIIPHLCRLLLGPVHARVLPASALCGGLLLLWSDAAARTVLPGGVELPVGVITALLGGPFFCMLLGRNGARRPDPTRRKEVALSVQGASRAGAETEESRRAVSQAHLEARGLSFRYGDGLTDALCGVSFALEQGGNMGVLGPNASGKSTLLGCLAGTLAPYAGEVTAQGRPVRSMGYRERARVLAALPQRPEALPALSSLHLALMGRYCHTPFPGGYGREDLAKAAASLEATGVAHLAHRSAGELSGGELQRVLLARALAQEAPLLLLDEAPSGLDPACRTAIMEVLARRCAETGLTVISALHDLNLAALYCERIMLLKAGRVMAEGPVHAVFTREALEEVYETPVRILPHPDTGRPQALLGGRNDLRSGKIRPPLFRLAAFLLPLAVLFGGGTARAEVRIMDDAGREIRMAAPAMRIAPLYAALGEIMAAMGIANRAVGRTAQDTALPESLPVVGSHMRPNLEVIAGLAPDLALQMEGREEAGQTALALERMGIPVARFRVASFADLFSCIHRLGVLAGKERAADDLARSLEGRLRKAGERTARMTRRPSVFFEARYPNLLGAGGGSMITDIIRAAGGENILAAYPDRLVRLSEEMLAVLDPDIYVFQQGPMNKKPVPPRERPHFAALAAVRRQETHQVEEERFSRPGPGCVEAVEELAGIILAWDRRQAEAAQGKRHEKRPADGPFPEAGPPDATMPPSKDKVP